MQLSDTSQIQWISAQISEAITGNWEECLNRSLGFFSSTSTSGPPPPLVEAYTICGYTQSHHSVEYFPWPPELWENFCLAKELLIAVDRVHPNKKNMIQALNDGRMSTWMSQEVRINGCKWVITPIYTI